MNFIKHLLSKASVGQANFYGVGDCAYSMAKWEEYAKEGYGLNPTVYACVRKIAENAAGVTPLVRVNGERVEGHPLETLLAQPNMDEGGIEFRTAAYSWMMISGNCFTEKLVVGGLPRELWNWQPYQMSVASSANNPRMPARYTFDKSGKATHTWDVDLLTGKSDLLHWRTFNPDPEASFFGQAPLKAGASSADQLNAADKWRYNSFKNDCRPSGILSTDNAIDEKQRKSLQGSLDNKQSGWWGAAKTMLLGGGLKWQQLGVSAKDADWLNGSKYNKQGIAEVFGVPTQLLGIEGSMTFSNMEQAIVFFYNQTVLPLVDLYISELNRWIAPDYGDNVEVYYEINDIKALEPERRESLKTRLESDVLTMNEKRELIGYEPVTELEADQLYIDSNKIPLGLDIFTEEEKQVEDAAKSLMRLGLPREEAEQKAFDIVQERAKYGASMT